MVERTNKKTIPSKHKNLLKEIYNNKIRRYYWISIGILIITVGALIYLFVALFTMLLPITSDISTFSISSIVYLITLLMLFDSEKHNLMIARNQEVEFNLIKVESLKDQIQKVYEPLDIIIHHIENKEKIIQKNEIELFENVYLNRYIVNENEQNQIENMYEIFLKEKSFENIIDQLHHFKGKAKEIQKEYNELRGETDGCL